MGLIDWLIGGGLKQAGGVVERVGGVFRPNAENEAVRRSDSFDGARRMYSKEFRGEGIFNRIMDAINRLPRPMLSLGTIGLFIYAFKDPVGFAIVMKSLDLVPTELWWMLSTITVFYFGGRELHKIRQSRPVKAVVSDIQQLRRLRDHLTPDEAADDSAQAGMEISGDGVIDSKNKAVLDWKRDG